MASCVEAGRITPAERRWVWLLALVVVALTGLPYLVAWAHQTPEWHFSGFLFGVEDGHSYIAKMLSGAAGAWLFRTPYTALPTRPMLAFAPYLWLGKLVGPSHDRLVVAFHLFRSAAAVALVHATYDFLALYLPEVAARRWGTAWITLGGGLGWLLIPWGGLPLAFYSPEAFGFLALYGLPHLALARALLLWGWRALQQGHPWRGGCYWLGCGLAQPLTLAVGWAVLGVWVLVTRLWREPAERRRLAVFLSLSAPLLGYTVLWQWLDPFFRIWSAQNVLPSPPPWAYLLAYGLLLPWALPGARALWRERPRWGALLPLWALTGLGMAYLPLTVQRRLVEGVWVALVGLALRGMPAGRRPWVSLGLGVPTVLLLLFGVQTARRPAAPVFLPTAAVQAFQAVAGQVPSGAVVLAAYPTGNALPAWAPVRVVLGHGVETAHIAQVRQQVATFFRAETDSAWRRRFLQSFGVQYLLIGPAERALGDFDPHSAPYLTLRWQSAGYALWQVSP